MPNHTKDALSTRKHATCIRTAHRQTKSTHRHNKHHAHRHPMKTTRGDLQTYGDPQVPGSERVPQGRQIRNTKVFVYNNDAAYRLDGTPQHPIRHFLNKYGDETFNPNYLEMNKRLKENEDKLKELQKKTKQYQREIDRFEEEHPEPRYIAQLNAMTNILEGMQRDLKKQEKLVRTLTDEFIEYEKKVNTQRIILETKKNEAKERAKKSMELKKPDYSHKDLAERKKTFAINTSRGDSNSLGLISRLP